MLKRLPLRDRLSQMLDRWTASARAAYLASVQEATDEVVLQDVARALERGDVESATDAAAPDPLLLGSVLDELDQAFEDAGRLESDAIGARDQEGRRLTIRFDVRNPGAESWLSRHSSGLVTAVSEDQRAAVRAALSRGLEVGANPRRTALDVVGRAGLGGTRSGGVIGLALPQESYVASARRELSSGDPRLMEHYLTRGRRDARYDGAVRRAIAEGRSLDADTVVRATGRYADRLLYLRGEMLARTETLTSLNGGRDESMRQAIQSGAVDAQTVESIWHTHVDGRERDTHLALNGIKVPFGSPFRSPSGALIRYPGDPDAPAAERIGCRCWVEHRVDFLAGIS